VSIVAGTPTAFWRRLERPAIQNRRSRLLHPFINLAHQHAQVVNHVLKHASLQPPLRLLIHCMPWRQVVGYHAPLHARAHNVTQTIEYLAQRVLSLWNIFSHQGQVQRHKRPRIIGYVTKIAFSCYALSIPQSRMKVPSRLQQVRNLGRADSC
jgi:hypothetical protein